MARDCVCVSVYVCACKRACVHVRVCKGPKKRGQGVRVQVCACVYVSWRVPYPGLLLHLPHLLSLLLVPVSRGLPKGLHL